MTRAAVFAIRETRRATAQFGVIQALARTVQMAEVRPIGLQDPLEIERGIVEFARDPNGGLIVTPNGLAIVHRELIINLGARYKLPAIYPFQYFVEGGGLVAYGPDVADQYRLDFHDHATVDLVVAHAAEDAVDVFQPFRRVVDLHLAVGGELQALANRVASPRSILEWSCASERC